MNKKLLEALKELSYQAVRTGINVGAPVEFTNALTMAQRVIYEADHE